MPLAEEMRVGPFASFCGICISNPTQHYEYQSAIKTMIAANSQLQMPSVISHRLKDLEVLVKEIASTEAGPSEPLELINALTFTTVSHDQYMIFRGYKRQFLFYRVMKTLLLKLQ